MITRGIPLISAASGGAMAGMDHGAMDMPASDASMEGMDHSGMAMGAASGEMAMPGVDRTGLRPPGTIPEPTMHGPDDHGKANAMAPMQTRSRLHEPGVGLGDDGRRVLVYTDLKALHPEPRPRGAQLGVPQRPLPRPLWRAARRRTRPSSR